MKKGKSEKIDWLRAQYRRKDLGPIVRGKYAKRIAAASNVVVLDPVLAKIFPNDVAVNAALKGLVELARATTRSAARSAKRRSRADRVG
ncbi:MAG: hypothetical protein FJY56_05395 [Betaproteobacteria bacterium]|nr:hypothetical protein [Betaproteobacteria bacterium]